MSGAAEVVCATVVGGMAATTLGLCGSAHVKEVLNEKRQKAASLTNLPHQAWSEPYDQLKMPEGKHHICTIKNCSLNGEPRKDYNGAEAKVNGEVLLLGLAGTSELKPVMCLGGAELARKGPTVTLTTPSKEVTLTLESDAEARTLWHRMSQATKLPGPEQRIFDLVEHVVTQAKVHQDNRKIIQRLEAHHKAHRHGAEDPIGLLTSIKETREKLTKHFGVAHSPASHASHGQLVVQGEEFLLRGQDGEQRRREVQFGLDESDNQMQRVLVEKERTIQDLTAQLQVLDEKQRRVADLEQLQGDTAQVCAERDAHALRARELEEFINKQASDHEQLKMLMAQAEQEVRVHRDRALQLEEEVHRIRTEGAANGTSQAEADLIAQLEEARQREAALAQQAAEREEALKQELVQEFEAEFAIVRQQASQLEAEAIEKSQGIELLIQERDALVQQLQMMQSGGQQSREERDQLLQQLEAMRSGSQQERDELIRQLEELRIGGQQQMQKNDALLRELDDMRSGGQKHLQERDQLLRELEDLRSGGHKQKQEYNALVRQLEDMQANGGQQQVQAQAQHVEEIARLEQEYQQRIAELEQRNADGINPEAFVQLQEQYALVEAKLKNAEQDLFYTRQSADEIVHEHGKKLDQVQALEAELAEVKAQAAAEANMAQNSYDQGELLQAHAAQQELIQALEQELAEARQVVAEADVQRGQLAMLQAERDALHQRLNRQTQMFEMQVKELEAKAKESRPSDMSMGSQEDKDMLIAQLQEANKVLSEENNGLKEQMANTWQQINEQMTRLDEERSRYLEEVRRAKETSPQQTLTYQLPTAPLASSVQPVQVDRALMQQQLDEVRQSFNVQVSPQTAQHLQVAPQGQPQLVTRYGLPSQFGQPAASLQAPHAERQVSNSPYNSYVANATNVRNHLSSSTGSQAMASPTLSRPGMTAPLQPGPGVSTRPLSSNRVMTMDSVQPNWSSQPMGPGIGAPQQQLGGVTYVG